MRALRLPLLVLVAVGLAFHAPVQDGRSLLTLSGLKARLAGPGGAADAAPSAAGAERGERIVYKWRGEDGSWRYSNVRPADHPEAQEVRASVSWVEGAPEAPAPEGRPRTARELLEASKGARGKAEERNAQMEELMREADP